MNKLSLSMLIPFFGISMLSSAQNLSYYEKSIGLHGADLKSTLSDIISHAGSISYGGLWTAYHTTDKRDDGKVIDVYSATTNFTFGSNQCGNYKKEGDCYNREHSVPKSWFNDASPMYSDIWHVVPSDGYVNGRRSNYPFGEVGNAKWSSHQNHSKVGSSITPGISGTVFEPHDEFKGDFARIYFYMATRYEARVGSWGGGVFSRSYPHLQKGSLDLFLKWHREDPVSNKEIERNEAVYKTNQRNRNPYIDYPELVDLIFGNRQGEVFDPNETSLSNEKENHITVFIDGQNIHLGNTPVGAKTSIYDLTGRLIYKGITTEESSTIFINYRGTAVLNITSKSTYFAKKVVL